MTISASRRVVVVSLHSNASSPGEDVVAGFFFAEEAVRTEPRRPAQASVPVDLLGGPLLPERDVEGEAPRDVRGIGEVLQGPRRLSGAETKQVPALLLLLQQQVAPNIVAGF